MPNGMIRGSCLAEGKSWDRSRFLCKWLHNPTTANQGQASIVIEQA
jgi:hypothetical protein